MSVDRITLQFSSQARAALDDIQRLGRFRTMDEAIAHTLGDELFFLEKRAAGWEVFLRRNGEVGSVMWDIPA